MLFPWSSARWERWKSRKGFPRFPRRFRCFGGEEINLAPAVPRARVVLSGYELNKGTDGTFTMFSDASSKRISTFQTKGGEQDAAQSKRNR